MNITWENFEGETEAYGDTDGYDFEISIGARVHANSKWGVSASNLRGWTVRVNKGLDEVGTVEGRTETLPKAKKAALAALADLLKTN